MRRGAWRRGAIGLVTGLLGGAAAWSGYTLIAPDRIGLAALPAQVTALPFDRGFWATALLILGGALILKAAPNPPWAKGR